MHVHQPTTSRPNRRLGRHALTWGFPPAAPTTHVVYYDIVQLPERDREIVQLVGRFKQLTTAHIQALVYPNQKHDPQRRAIKRLLDGKLLARVTERLPGGARGGSQMYVYQLGSLGRKLYGYGRRGHSIVVNHHALAVADVFVALKEAERRGELRLLNWAVEPDCHIDFGGVHVEPDLYIDVVTQTKDGALRHPIWVELDLATEDKRDILEKVAVYSRAYEARADYPLPIYPTVLWLATRDERASELAYWMRYAKVDPEYVHTVSTVQNLLLTILQR